MAEWLVSGGLLPDEEHQANGRYGRTAEVAYSPSPLTLTLFPIGLEFGQTDRWACCKVR